jgi:predicted RNA-binding protein associated with RNAse of E/G family
MSSVPELAAFLADNPSLPDQELTRALEAGWGTLTPDEAEQALRIVRQIRDAQAGLTELQRLIERTRALHGTSVAASMLYRYQTALGRAA